MLSSVNNFLHFYKYFKSIRLLGSIGRIHVVFVQCWDVSFMHAVTGRDVSALLLARC